MSVALVTGAWGLVGSEACRHLAARGLHVVGIDNDMRGYFFGEDASTAWTQKVLEAELGASYEHVTLDVRDRDGLASVFRRHAGSLTHVVHAAGQPSHDWAAKEPYTDFDINAGGTLNVLESCRTITPDAGVVLTSTNKVYGARPNSLPVVEAATRWTLPDDHPWAQGVPETMSIDQTLHSVFGAGKVAADMMAQEYGRYFGLNVGVFRCGGITGSGHSAAELHGFMAYLMRCGMEGRTFRIFGYGGKQVRDTIHARDLVSAFDRFIQDPHPGAVYNIGGGPSANCSLLEAIAMVETITGRPMSTEYVDEPRIGDHIWWISDTTKFEQDYPGWKVSSSVQSILEEMFERNSGRWAHSGRPSR